MAANTLGLPFDTWRPIFQLVFQAETDISDPPSSEYILSPLHSRNLIYLSLALVCKGWKTIAYDVFLEQLEGRTAESLDGLLGAKGPCAIASQARAVSSIHFSFWDFRCSISRPRRPRPLKHPVIAVPDEDDEQGVAQFNSIQNLFRTHQRKTAEYSPSGTRKGSHWAKWHGQVSGVLHCCTSLREVRVSFTPDTSSRYRSDPAYIKLFPAPDLKNQGIIHGLLASTNLRSLYLIDPTPLKEYGPALASWVRLKDLTIILTRNFPELSETEFFPPRALERFEFRDRGDGSVAWPAASDLGRCENLKSLTLEAYHIQKLETTGAISFLLLSYQDTLEYLELAISGPQLSTCLSANVLTGNRRIRFTQLQTLRVLAQDCDLSLYNEFDTDRLEALEAWTMYLPPATSRTAEETDDVRWRRGIPRSALARLKVLRLLPQHGEHVAVDRLLERACQALGIRIESGHEPVVQEPEFEDDE